MSNVSRKRARFHPYAFAEDGLEMQMSVVLDDGSLLVPANEQRTLHLGKTWSSAKLEIECRATDELLKRVLPLDEQTTPSAEYVVSYRCPRTFFFLGKSVALASKNGGVSSCKLTLSAADVDHEIIVALELVRTDRAKSPVTGFASLRGMRLATAPSWTLHLAPPAESRGRYLDIRYTSFAQDAQIPNELQGSLFHVLTSNPTHPILFLNRDHALTHHSLNSRGKRGRQARARDLALSHVVAQVWPELLLIALRDLDALEDSLPWQSGVLERWLPSLYPHSDSHPARCGEALSELKADAYNFRKKLDTFFRGREGFGHLLEKLLGEPS